MCQKRCAPWHLGTRGYQGRDVASKMLRPEKNRNSAGAALASTEYNCVNATPAGDKEVGAGIPVIIMGPGLGVSLKQDLHCCNVRREGIPRLSEFISCADTTTHIAVSTEYLVGHPESTVG